MGLLYYLGQTFACLLIIAGLCGTQVVLKIYKKHNRGIFLYLMLMASIAASIAVILGSMVFHADSIEYMLCGLWLWLVSICMISWSIYDIRKGYKQHLCTGIKVHILAIVTCCAVPCGLLIMQNLNNAYHIY